jgi:hypothetical protein
MGAIAATACATTLLGAGAAGAAPRLVPRCAVFELGRVRYGVYVVRGPISCEAAISVLEPVDRGRGRFVDRYNSLYSYTLIDGWLCPVASRGFQACEHDRRPTARPRWLIISRPCLRTGSSCPAFGRAPKPL